MYTLTQFKKINIKEDLIDWFDYSPSLNYLLFLSIHNIQKIRKGAVLQSFFSFFPQKNHANPIGFLLPKSALPKSLQKEKTLAATKFSLWSSVRAYGQLTPHLLYTCNISLAKSIPCLVGQWLKSFYTMLARKGSLLPHGREEQ